MKSIALPIALSCMLLAAPALAAPPQLLDHTITVSFTATGQGKSPEGQVHSFNTQVSRIIYVSSAGRLFMRHRAANSRGNSRGGDFAPGEGGGSFSFQGSRLVGVLPYGTGARQITVTFDPGFSSCTASVIEGGSGGVIRRKGPNGIMYEITGATTSSVSCSIRNGNAFAG
ncbi:MAG TPA: hypothetical protein VJR30_00335 [Bradyrhizobium sp.]|nr:hypothetical protein [Bradyrhizobium sp.]